MCRSCFLPLLRDIMQAYNWESYLCRYFRANCTTSAWSGGTLLPMNSSSSCPGRAYLPRLYTQAFATDASLPWDFSRSARPDAVIIYLGTNDYSCNVTTDALFTAAQLTFMQNITNYYSTSPGAAEQIQFFLAIGPMSPTKPLNATLTAIQEATANGYKATLLDMTNATLDGCGGHPGPIGHWQMALKAAPQIKSVMGW